MVNFWYCDGSARWETNHC
ncbi:H-X9-DG-CTERM domain-containing protein [Plebeiibacterium sediminum]